MCLCGCWLRLDADVLEQGLHADAQGLVVAVGGGPGLGFAAHPGAADSGQDRGDDMVAEGEQGADSAGGGWRDVVAAEAVRACLPPRRPPPAAGPPPPA